MAGHLVGVFKCRKCNQYFNTNGDRAEHKCEDIYDEFVENNESIDISNQTDSSENVIYPQSLSTEGTKSEILCHFEYFLIFSNFFSDQDGLVMEIFEEVKQEIIYLSDDDD